MAVTISLLSTTALDNIVPSISAINNEGMVLGTDPGAIWQNGVASGLTGVWYADAINNLGQVVGTTLTGRAVEWQNGTVQNLPTLGGTVSLYSEAANGINDSGLIVGASAAPGGLDEAVLWQNGVATNLGTLAGGDAQPVNGNYNSTAMAINASGQIVGFSLTSAGVYHAVMWQAGKISDLGVFAANDQSFAIAINASGEVVGYDMPASYESKAFLWQNGKMTNLGTLPGDDYSTAEAINSSGIIVGQAGIYANPSGNHAVMWQNGKIYDLNNLVSPTSGWFLETADAINDSGEIVGQGSFNGSYGRYEMILTGTATVIGATVQTALQSTVTASVAVVDSGANVLANLDALEGQWEKVWGDGSLLTSITLSDATAPAWTLTAAQFNSDANVLAVLQSPVSLTVTGAVLADPAAQISLAPLQLTSPLAVSDTSTNVGYWIDGLASGETSGKIGGITLTTGGTIDLSSDQLASDQAALKAITSQTFSLLVTPSSATATIDGAGYGTTVALSGNAALYTITPAGNGTGFTLSGNGVHDTISNVTMLQFSDKSVTIAASNSFAEYTALLYQGALGRTPDAGGLEHWTVLANGLTASERAIGAYALSNYSGNYNGTLSIAAGFTNSLEFQTNYGSLTDAQFVEQLYANILDRAPDLAGFNSWINALKPVAQGGLGESREYVLVGFAESSEALSNATQGFTGQSGSHAPWLSLI